MWGTLWSLEGKSYGHISAANQKKVLRWVVQHQNLANGFAVSICLTRTASKIIWDKLAIDMSKVLSSGVSVFLP